MPINQIFGFVGVAGKLRRLTLPNEWGVICMTETVLLVILLVALAEVTKEPLNKSH